ncbi:MAG: cytochrome c oxidase accessory protein CcoG [Betaproteobacteria bacterium]|nr:cytochrome c oxidase accessory protein CcoG [Betaproteobacteria bacterium]
MRAPARSIPLASVSNEVETALYEVRRKIHPRAVRGRFAAWRWALVWLTQIIFYGAPWLTWNERQAVLFDLGTRKFYIFGLVFWPQDFIFLAALLVVSALALFLFTAVGGRLWCGYACPQTVYTEIFMWIERVVEGDRLRRVRLDKEPWTARKLLLKSVKHGIWITAAAWTGFTFVGYFTPITTLAREVTTMMLGPWETFWILFYGFTTWGNAGFMREQVCVYMCPYARFQGVMFDPDTLVITYDARRGEPRGSRSRSTDRRAAGLGDCVECAICVQVCPTGIDIRRGLQYECIGCAACIDGCNQVMDRMGYPRGLIRYSTENAIEGKYAEAKILARVARPRVLVYGAVLTAIAAAMAAALYLRVPLKVDVIRDRAALARETGEGLLENVYRLQLMNTDEQPHRFRVSASGLEGVGVMVKQPVEVPAASTLAVPVALRIDPANVKPGSYSVVFHVEDVDRPQVRADEKSRFFVK